MIKACDTDVLVIAVSVLPSLQQSGLQQLRVSFGQRNNLCMNSVSPLPWQRLDKFCSTMHSLDAAFRGKGKKSEVSDVFAKLSQYPLTVDDEDLQILGKFVVIMYDRSSTAEGVEIPD